MRIALMGQAAFGEKTLQTLLDRGEEVVCVFVPLEDPGRGDDPLKGLAQWRNIPVFEAPNLKDPRLAAYYGRLAPDLGVMAFVTDIIPQGLLDLPRLGSIQYHPSLLPRHRGGSAINWAVIGGEAGTGLTIFWPDGGIDTGPILLQKAVEISPEDTTGSLYFNKLFPLGVEALMEAVDMVREGTAPRIIQDESMATYEGLCREEDAVISWGEPAAVVYNLIRGTNPQPGALTRFQGGDLKIFDCRLLPEPSSRPAGEVVEVGPEGFAVAASGGVVLVKRVQPRGSGKIGAPEYAESVALKAGDTLGN
jgi:methionyl-tRNA formyltransferase